MVVMQYACDAVMKSHVRSGALCPCGLCETELRTRLYVVSWGCGEGRCMEVDGEDGGYPGFDGHERPLGIFCRTITHVVALFMDV